MRQYFKIYLVEEKSGKEIILNRKVDNKYTVAGLMDHSWWCNPFMNAVCNMLYKNQYKIAWVGNYANESSVYPKVWGKNIDGISIKSTNFKLDNKYIVNHTKKIYINCNKYKEKNIKNNWVMHPLSLLTAIGNGRGDGDYYGICNDKIGIWYMDTLSIEDEIIDDYDEFEYNFTKSEYKETAKKHCFNGRMDVNE